MKIKGVIFDLDGVILSTDNFHYLAWKKMADRENIEFNREINNRLRGVSRMESLAIILEKASRQYSDSEKKEMATYKNDIYRESLKDLSPADIFPGVMDLFNFLLEKKIPIAIGSSSKNTRFILQQVGLTDLFEGAVCDGTDIKHSKPNPEVFIKAAVLINTEAVNCLVIEDADAGIEAAKAGNMIAMGVGPAAAHPKCDLSAKDLNHIDRAIFK